MDGRMEGWKNGGLEGWIDGWKNGGMDEWMDGWIAKYLLCDWHQASSLNFVFSFKYFS